MTDRRAQALERLKQVAERAGSEGSGMDIPVIIEAIVGPEYDEELEDLVSIALEANNSGMTLEEIATGILNLDAWRTEQA